MNNLFDIVGESRHLSDNELIYNITNSGASCFPVRGSIKSQ